MLTKDLQSPFYMFGNKGSVWSNKVHIAEGGSFSGTTLCGTPMLSSNHAVLEDVKEIGCKNCLGIYNDKVNKSSLGEVKS